MSRIALNLTYLDPGRTGGMEVVARALLPALMEAVPDDWELCAIMNRRAAESPGPWNELPVKVIDVDIESRPRWAAAELTQVPVLARKVRADLIHSLGNIGPWASSMPRSVTVNDLIHHVLGPDDLRLRVLARLVAGGASRAERVIVAATQTRDDLVRLTSVDASRVDIVPYGMSLPQVEPVPEAELRARFDLGDRPLVLSPSARQPHKNLDRLIEAHALVPAGERPLLVLPGYETPQDDALRRRTTELGLDDDMRWLGWIEQDELEGFYAASELLLFPSLYEGFGLPVLEAMQRGLPVACSDRGSLAEVAGGAALIFDPEDPAAIAAAMSRLHGDAMLREELRALGRAHAAGYTWEACAAGYVDSLARALGADRRPAHASAA
ncbi:MAG: glycosyltransferase family 1 protein [Solirubrobacteraceae bacterium]|nr:glycosyltransferase family 1 protein [Solirubrobacteraceae bacterium]